MSAVEPSRFYTGLVAELYETLRSAHPDPAPYARFVRRYGEPALELGCGGGDPLLALRADGLDVEGLDSSPDMLRRCRSRARAAGIDVVLHETPIEEMDLGRRYQAIFLAGATFNLLPSDELAGAALERIGRHLSPTGAALVPLFIPQSPALGDTREERSPDGTVMRVTTVGSERDERLRLQTTRLRYEHDRATDQRIVERDWVLHWHSQPSFRALAERSGLRVSAVLDRTGRPADTEANEFSFVLALPES